MASPTVVGVLRTYRQQIVSRLTGRIQELELSLDEEPSVG